MSNFTFPAVCLVIIAVCMTYFLKQCPSCFRGLTEKSFDSYQALDKLYRGTFASGSDLGVEGTL